MAVSLSVWHICMGLLVWCTAHYGPVSVPALYSCSCLSFDYPTDHLCVSVLQDMFCLYTPGGGGYGEDKQTAGDGRLLKKRRRLNDNFSERGSVFEYRMAQEGV